MFDDGGKIRKFLAIYAKNPAIYEVEARLGRFEGSGFVAGISKHDFRRMIKFHEKAFPSETSTTNQRISGELRHENNKVIQKATTDRVDLTEYDVRISLSREIAQPKYTFDGNSIKTVMCYTRHKKRTSFTICPQLRLDFTEVVSSQGDALDGPEVTYEVELEVIQETSENAMRDAIVKLLQYWKETYFVLSKSEYDSIDRTFCHLVAVRDTTSFAGAQPRTMQKVDMDLLELKPYAITYKLDGTRTYMYIAAGGQVFLITSAKFKKIAALDTLQFDNTVLDGELVKKFHAFDVICWKGVDLRGNEEYNCLQSRLELIESLVNFKGLVGMFYAKEYHFTEPNPSDVWDESLKFGGKLNAMLSEPSVHGEPDGLIFVPTDEAYPRTKSWKGLLKWKERVTIDFRVRDNRLFANATPSEIEFKPASMPRAGRLKLGPTSTKLEDGKIYEFYWDIDLQTFTPLRPRGDKLKPNFIDIALDNFHAIQNPVPLDMLVGKTYDPRGYPTYAITERIEPYNVSLTDAFRVIRASKEEVEASNEEDFRGGVCNAVPMLVVQEEEDLQEDEDDHPVESQEREDDATSEADPDSCDESEAAIEEVPSSVRKAPRKMSRKKEPPVLLFGKPVKQWRLPDLKAKCAECNLKVKGKKAVLIEHLQLWESNNGKPV